jgi:hypothetical protein
MHHLQHGFTTLVISLVVIHQFYFTVGPSLFVVSCQTPSSSRIIVIIALCYMALNSLSSNGTLALGIFP